MEPTPFVDQHTVTAAATPEAVWDAARRRLDAPLRGVAGRYARMVGVEGDRPFTVQTAERPVLLGLVGRHRFSRYSLTLTVRPVGAGRSTVTAHTSAVFPGVAGRIYRLLVIDSRAHVLVTRWLLRGIARAAERR